MKKRIAFLRGINVGGQKKIKMAELRDQLTEAGLIDVATYIQSGNIIFKSDSIDFEKLASTIEKVILEKFGFEVPTLVLAPETLLAILDTNPFSVVAEEKNLYFALLYQPPKPEMMANLNPLDYPNERFSITKNCVYLNCLKGAGNAKLTNNLIERKLGVTATTRNLRTMLKML